jgi:Methyltransferase domain.
MADLALDPCCGARAMYFDPADQRVLFGDLRDETRIVTDNSLRNRSGVRALEIHPDVRMDFRALPFADETFTLVVFDPPHLIQAGPRSWLAARYGKLGNDWREDLRRGFSECWRVLRPSGTLIFKWNQTQIPTREVIKLAPQAPLFGHRSGKRSGTHWFTFLKLEATHG